MLDRVRELLIKSSWVKFKPEKISLLSKSIFKSFLKKSTILFAVLSPISSINDKDSVSKFFSSSIDFMWFKSVLEADSPTYLIPFQIKLSEMVYSLIHQFHF